MTRSYWRAQEINETKRSNLENENIQRAKAVLEPIAKVLSAGLGALGKVAGAKIASQGVVKKIGADKANLLMNLEALEKNQKLKGEQAEALELLRHELRSSSANDK